MRGQYKVLIPTIAMAALAPPAVQAQSLNTWSLPEPEQTTPSTVQGPVDAENPSVRPVQPQERPAGQPSASVTPTPVPTITPPPAVRAPQPTATANSSPASRESAGTSTAPARPQPSRTPETTNSVSPAPTASPTATAVPPLPEPAVREMSQSAGAEPGAFEAPPAASESQSSWWWWALPVALAVLGLLIFLRRRAAPTAQTPARAAPAPQPTPQPKRAPLVTPKAEAPPAAKPAATPEDISIALQPVMMRLSLFYATLQFRLTVTSSEDREALSVFGDLSSAHASLSRDEQLAPPLESLAQLHTLPEIGPGKSCELKGEVQLPLGAIRALRRSGGAFFVPLVRLCLVGADGTALRRVFTLGIPGGESGLAPLRIDTGPRNFESLAAREIEAARDLPLNMESLPLDPQRAAG